MDCSACLSCGMVVLLIIAGCRLFHSLMVLGKKGDLAYLVLSTYDYQYLLLKCAMVGWGTQSKLQRHSNCTAQPRTHLTRDCVRRLESARYREAFVTENTNQIPANGIGPTITIMTTLRAGKGAV